MVFTLWFVDAILFKGTDFTADAIIIQNIHDEFKFSDVHLQDVLHLEEGPRLDWTNDAQLILRPNFVYTVDAFVQQQNNDSQFTVDANAQIMPSQNYTVDAFLQKEFDTSITTDAIVVDRETDDSLIDASLVRRLDNTFTIDPITIGTLESEPIIDAFLSVENIETTFLVDSIPEIIPEVRPRVDALLRETFTDAIIVDAVVILRPTPATKVDAILQKPGFQPFNVDAFLLDAFGEFTQVDAQLVLPNGNIDICTVHLCTPTQPVVFYTVDAIVIEPVAFTWTVDAHIESGAGTDNFTLDALLSTIFGTTFTLDVNLIVLSQFNACPSIGRDNLNCVSVIRRRGT
ncbi:MAG: hypothetical protein E4H14_20360 [Candidatus Thorarchaeota archaeon]|nr:MAG: hypothetical protein E4H14_20360 [Candidatus Thorarchaeota archaeon]